MLSLSNWIDRDPKHFEYLHRVMGYAMLSLLLVVYHYTSPETKYQIYVPILLGVVALILPKLSNWLEFKFGYHAKRNTLFAIDVVVIAIMLSAVHLSLVLTFTAIFAILFSSINTKVSFFSAMLTCVFGVAVFYFSNIFIFGFGEYFEHTSSELTVLSFLCLITYFGVGIIYQSRRIRYIHTKREYYYNQMNRYMEFANQLSRYAPLQLWQSIMKGESEAKIEYKRKKMTVFFPIFKVLPSCLKH